MIEVHFKEDVLSICNNDKFYYKPMRFSAGEEFIKFNGASHVEKVTWYYEGDHELMQLALLVDMIGYNKTINLDMPYIPHARQDRATTESQPFSLQVFCRLLSEIFKARYLRLRVVDPHSEVSVDLLKDFARVEVIKQSYYAKHFGSKYDYIVAPDKGAVHKTAEWARDLGVPMFCCDKVRDPQTGWITSYKVPNVNLHDKNVLVVDDIIDGGRSVIMVSDTLRKQGCNLVDVFATHGIFSKGIDIFSDINHIWTTDSLPHAKKIKNLGCDKLTIFNCFE